MPTVWSFQYFVAGQWSAPVLFTDAQVISATRTLVNQGIDTVSMVFAGTQPPGAGGFAYGSLIRIFRDDFDGTSNGGAVTGLSNPKGWFTGRVVAPKKAALGNSESCTVLLSGPWWYLQNIVYQQLGLYYLPTATVVESQNQVVDVAGSSALTTGPLVYFGQTAVQFSPTPTLQLSSDIILTQNQQDGVPMDGAQTLTDALEWAISRGARLAIGSLPQDQAIPSEAATDPTCADMVRKVLKWLPGVVSWFDYSVDPPTINFADRTTRPATTLAMGGNAPQVQTATLQARPDLVLPGVTLYYLRKLTLNSVISSTSTTGGVSTTTIPGSTEETQPAESETETNAGLSFSSGYISSNTTTVQGAGGSGSTSTTNTNSSQQVNVIQVDRAGPDPDGIGAMVATIQLQGGNVPATSQSTTPAPPFEPTPVGLAETIWQSRQLLSYDGSIVCKGQDLINLGNPLGTTINIAGGEPEWAAMLAEVQTVVENTATAATTLTVGAPTHLGPSDLAALLQANRLRQYVSLADSLGRTTGGAAIPPSDPVPPTPPSKSGGNPGGGTGGGNPAAQPTDQGGAGILDVYSGTVNTGPTDLGIASRESGGGPYPAGNTLLQSPPASGNPVLALAGGGGQTFSHSINASYAVTGQEGHPGPGDVDWIGSGTCTETYTMGDLDLTSYPALSYLYAELRGSMTTSNADGTSTTTSYVLPVSQYLGLRQPGFRVYASVGAPHDNTTFNGVSTRSLSGSLTMTGPFVIPRVS